jgi:hypothetical protein
VSYDVVIFVVLIVGAIVTTIGTAKALVKSDEFYFDGPLSIAFFALCAGLIWPIAIPLGILTKWIRNLQERKQS